MFILLMMVLKIEKIQFNKRHSLTIYIVKYVTDSLLKNNGINSFSLVGTYIEKSIDIDQLTFHKKN